VNAIRFDAGTSDAGRSDAGRPMIEGHEDPSPSPSPGSGPGASGAPGLAGTAPKRDEWIYVGDSPNDEPLFAAFALSVGVANLRPYLPRLKSPPKWITSKPSGEGFVELADKLIAVRSK
jgi:hypothetical protein